MHEIEEVSDKPPLTDSGNQFMLTPDAYLQILIVLRYHLIKVISSYAFPFHRHVEGGVQPLKKPQTDIFSGKFF